MDDIRFSFEGATEDVSSLLIQCGMPDSSGSSGQSKCELSLTVASFVSMLGCDVPTVSKRCSAFPAGAVFSLSEYSVPTG